MMWSGLATTCVAAMLLPILLPQPAVFRENRLEVTYTLPAGLVPEPDGRNLLDRAKEAATVPGDKVRLSCLSIPLRMKSPTNQPYERLVVFETNLDCLDRGLPDIAEVAGTTMRTLMGSTTTTFTPRPPRTTPSETTTPPGRLQRCRSRASAPA